MKRFTCLLAALVLVVSLAACQKEPEVDVLTEEELEEILGEVILGEEVNLDDYSEEEQEQIKDSLDKDGYEIDDGGILVPKDPVSEEKLDEIIDQAINNGTVDLEDYDEAQKEQIKDKLEEEGLKPDDGKEDTDDSEVPVVPIPTLTDAEVSEILNEMGITEQSVMQENFRVEANLSAYPKNQQQQIIRAAGMLGLEYKTEDGKHYFVGMTIHIDDIEDNPYE